MTYTYEISGHPYHKSYSGVTEVAADSIAQDQVEANHGVINVDFRFSTLEGGSLRQDWMQAMVFEKVGRALVQERRKIPEAGRGQVLLKVAACGVCRTDLHVTDGELTEPKLPLVLGHEIVGRIIALGKGVAEFDLKGLVVGARVGVPWLGWTCGICRYCLNNQENLCESARFTGYTLDGGYAEYAVADARYCFPIDAGISDCEAAPLLCAGLIGYRSLKMAGEAQSLGIYGFGAAAHIVAQVAQYQGRRIFAFVRPGDRAAAEFALSLGAEWVGDSDRQPPEPLDAAIIYAPVGSLVPAALAAVRPGGTVVCAGIHMSPIPEFSYDLLWRERKLVSVANLTRGDGVEFLALASKIPIKTSVERFPLADANSALTRLRNGQLTGAAVLEP